MDLQRWSDVCVYGGGGILFCLYIQFFIFNFKILLIYYCKQLDSQYIFLLQMYEIIPYYDGKCR